MVFVIFIRFVVPVCGKAMSPVLKAKRECLAGAGEDVVPV
jgi:hypothetical protein